MNAVNESHAHCCCRLQPADPYTGQRRARCCLRGPDSFICEHEAAVDMPEPKSEGGK